MPARWRRASLQSDGSRCPLRVGNEKDRASILECMGLVAHTSVSYLKIGLTNYTS